MKMSLSIVRVAWCETSRIFTLRMTLFPGRRLATFALVLILVFSGCTLSGDTNEETSYDRNEPIYPLEGKRHGGSSRTVAPANFENGDLLFRRGHGHESWFITRLYPRSPYSHVGIVIVQDSVISVVHVVPGQRHVIEEPVASFLSSRNTAKASLYRLRVENSSSPSRNIQIDQAVAAARRYVHERIVFDDAFDIHSPNELYCTELVWRAYRSAGIDLTSGQQTRTWIPGCSSPCLLPSRLLKSQHMRKIGMIEPFQISG